MTIALPNFLRNLVRTDDESLPEPAWGQSGVEIFNRTYSRVKEDGSMETWEDTVRRVVRGNTSLVDSKFIEDGERERLFDLIYNFKILPAGRHLWMSGVPGRSFLYNCLRENTLIHTDEGLIPVRELAGRTVNVLSEGRTYRPAEFRSFGEQELMKVTLTTGEVIYATPDHEWVVYNSGKFYRRVTKDLAGKKLPYNPAVVNNNSDDFREGVARGMIWADGTKVSANTAITVLFGEKQSLVSWLLPFGSTAVDHDAQRPGYGVRVNGLPVEWKQELPKANASREAWRGVIAGLIATDGHVDARGVVSITSSDREALEKIWEGAAYAGFTPLQIKVIRETSNLGEQYGPCYAFRIPRHAIQLGDLIREDQAARFDAVPVKPSASGRVVSVASVEATGIREEVFCGTEMETHTLTIGSGILTGNCFVSGWTENLSDHFAFTFSQLLQGGGVGANYSNKYLSKYTIQNEVDLYIVSDDDHRDYELMRPFLDEDVTDHFAAPVVDYAVEDSREGWVESLKKLIDLATRTNPQPYAGVAALVLDVTDVRPMGEPIRGFGGTASGPAPLVEMLRQVADIINGAVGRSLTSLEAMLIEHYIAGCVVAGNVRRSARMSIKHWADSDIFDFIDCKKSGLAHWSTNISVEIDDEFIALNRKVTRDFGPLDVQARKVYRALVEGMLNNGEPGIWNSTLANVGEPNTIIATNPCGEICLEGFEPCNLGHVNLDAFVNSDGTVDDYGMAEAHRFMTRFLMRATFGDITDPKTQAVNDRNRRIGVGHFGFAGFLAKQKIMFSEASRDDRVWDTLLEMSQVVDDAAAAYAHKLRIPVPVKKRTVAPTGTIAKLAGRGEGAHPAYARYFIRRIRYSMTDPRQSAKVEEFRAQGYNVVPDIYSANSWVVEIPTKEALVSELEDMGIEAKYLQSQDEIELADLLDVQAMYQTAWADNAVSFTVNVPKDKYSVVEVMSTLLPRLHKLKGTTMMVDESRELAPYERMTAAAYYASEIQSTDASYDAECSSGACPIR